MGAAIGMLVIASSVTMGATLYAGAIIGWTGLSVLAVAVAAYYKNTTEKQAKTQYHYIDEMMDMGVSIFDLRVNNKNWNELDAEDDYDDNVNI